jgi:hypothetical protein
VTVVPTVVDKRPREAFEVLQRDRLTPILLGVPTRKSDGNLGYHVAVQEPAAGEDVEDGTRVYLALEVRLLSFGTLEGPAVAPPGTPAPAVVGLELEEAMSRVTTLGLIAVVFQPKRAVTTIHVTRQDPEPGEPAPFREVGIWLD